MAGNVPADCSDYARYCFLPLQDLNEGQPLESKGPFFDLETLQLTNSRIDVQAE